MTAIDILKNICKENTHLLDFPEMQDIEKVIDELLTGKPTQEQFNQITDLRIYFINSQIDFKQDALWYLGDQAQLDYHANGWINFPQEDKPYGQIPPKHGKYLCCNLETGETFFEIWQGKRWLPPHKKVTHWKPLRLP